MSDSASNPDSRPLPKSRTLPKSIRTAEASELWQILREGGPEAIKSAIFNPTLTEDMAVFMAQERRTPPEALGLLASDARFKSSYKLKLSIAKNPKTPRRVVLSLLKFLKIFDLADLTKDQRLHISLRQKIEQSLSERIPALPSGVKSALAMRASGNVVMMLMDRGDGNVISACLRSPRLTEGELYKIINRPSTKPLLIKTLAEHSKWALRYDIRFALIRNFYTPMVNVVEFIKDMKTTDLKYLYLDPKLPASTRPFIHRELLSRGVEAGESEEEEVYSISEEMEEEDIE